MNVCKKDLEMLTDRISFETLILDLQHRRVFILRANSFFTGFDSLKFTFSIALITETHYFLNDC